MTRNEASERLQACEKLLSQAYLSYVRHEEGRREPFNLFTVLRSEHDEVRLHSRFLAALLNHRKAPGEPRENLRHFLETVVEHGVLAYADSDSDHATRVKRSLEETVAKAGDCKVNSVRVERESDNIDILVVNDAEPRWAVVVENKIRAGDQSEQLQRYHKSLTDRGFESENIQLLYLTPHGHEPTESSIGKLDAVCISYEDTLPSWLEGCRQRACDDPELRESVAQYLHLVRKLTGTDRGREYMNELKSLLLREGENLVLAQNLSEAMYEARAHLVHELWKDIENVMQRVEGFPDKSDKESRISLDAARGYVKGWRRYSGLGLYYPFGNGDARLFSEISSYEGDQVIIGLRFVGKKNDERVETLRKILEERGIKGNSEGPAWLWYRYIDNGWGLRNPEANHLRTMLCEDKRREVARNVAQGLKETWDAINA